MAKRKKRDIDFSKIAANIIKTPVEKFTEELYLPYAHYVIMDRALISDDGLKPVQRRILYAMHELGMTDKKDYVKAAQVVGETMGKYHPHGDSSIEEALGRMAQDFSLRVPLIDPHGNVGHNTGDKPSASRYWEARPTKESMELTREIKEGAIELGFNYDGKLREPAMLPVRFPNGLINGTQGIAVGYASNVVPHNPTEVMDSLIALVKNPDLTIEEIMEIMPGPDMPTGGTLVGYDGVKEYYETGKGTFAIRGNYEITPGNRGTHIITFYEGPYQVSAEQIIKKIDDNKKKYGRLKEVSYAKELAGQEEKFKLAIGIKAGANPNVVLKELFKRTQLENKFPANMNVLKYGVPRVSTIKQLLEDFIEFRKTCITNKINFKLEDIAKQIEKLSGIIKVLIDIDKAIKIIRGAKDSNVANTKLKKAFKINEDQADYILSMPLRRLTKFDSIKIKQDLKDFKAEEKTLKGVLKSKKKFKEYMIAELKETREIIKDDRRTVISNKTDEDLKKEARAIKKAATRAAKNRECYITLFADDTVTRSEKPYEQEGSPTAIIGHVRTKTKEEVMFITRTGQALKMKASFVPEGTIMSVKRATGLPENSVVGVSKVKLDKMSFGTLLVVSSGGVNIVDGGLPAGDKFEIVNLSDDEELVRAISIEASDYRDKSIFLVSSDGNALHFPLEQIRTSNSGAGTVKGINIEEGETLAGVSIVDPNKDAEIVSCTYKTIKVTPLSEVPGRNRSAKGVILQRLGKEDEVLNAFASERVVANKNGRSLRLPDKTDRALSGNKRKGIDVSLGHHTLD